MNDFTELERLTGLGLPMTIAFGVMSGELDEEFEITRIERSRKARDWAADPSNRKIKLSPKWDFDPARFYLVLDGESPAAFDEPNLLIIDAELAEVQSKLHPGCTRSSGPWDATYTSKTAEIAYLWWLGVPLTPALVSPIREHINILGGMHRFYLAIHHEETIAPFLVREDELDELTRLLTSAMVRNKEME